MGPTLHVRAFEKSLTSGVATFCQLQVILRRTTAGSSGPAISNNFAIVISDFYCKLFYLVCILSIVKGNRSKLPNNVTIFKPNFDPMKSFCCGASP